MQKHGKIYLNFSATVRPNKMCIRDREEICAKSRRIAVLENVMNPTNIGAIFRSAAALGMDAVLLTAAGSDPLYRRASRVSMGNVFLVSWTYLPEGVDWTKTLRQYGFKTAAMALREDSIRLNDPHLAREPKLAVVMGTEGDGLASDTIAHCDYTVMIPMTHGVDSLNAVSYTHLGCLRRSLSPDLSSTCRSRFSDPRRRSWP